MESVRFEVQGQNVELKVHASELLPLAKKLHSAAQEPDSEISNDQDLEWIPAGGSNYLIHLKGSPWESPMPESDLFLQSENLVNQLFREKLGNLAQIHAGCITSPSEKCFLICGQSGAGKTSITLASILNGWSWLSDEYALIEESAPRTILAFPRNFNIKERSWEQFPETAKKTSTVELYSGFHKKQVRLFNPNELRTESHIRNASLNAIIFPSYSPEEKTPTVNQIQGIAAMSRLLPEVQNAPAWIMQALTDWVQDLPCYEISYHDPREVPPFLETLI